MGGINVAKSNLFQLIKLSRFSGNSYFILKYVQKSSNMEISLSINVMNKVKDELVSLATQLIGELSHAIVCILEMVFGGFQEWFGAAPRTESSCEQSLQPAIQ